MAKPQSFNKRENEKKKAAKRIEKQKRKDERKANPGSGSLDDMIAYVDAHGNITDTPPEEEREEINLEDIEVSVPKKQDEEPDAPRNGVVEYFNSSKGYGFIKEPSSGEKYFFHISSAPASITERDKVTFETERSTRGMNAVKITVI